MDNPADFHAFRAQPVLPACAAARATQRKSRDQRAFLRGPVPWPWLVRASELGAAALMVALALRFFQGLQRGADEVKVSLAQLALGGADRTKARRGLNCLHDAGLVRVQRPPGSRLLVRFLTTPETSAPGTSIVDESTK
jgi:hypothetical protein